MEFSQINQRVRIAIQMLRVNDKHLLEHDVNERSITHKLAVYLDPMFGEEYHVDCEYNRDKDDPKKIKACMSKLKRTNNCKRIDEFDDKSVYPDIIVHKRGTNKYNLLAIEVKKVSKDSVTKEHDLTKLKCYTDQKCNLKYQYGAFIELYTKEKVDMEPEIVFYENGKPKIETLAQEELS